MQSKLNQWLFSMNMRILKIHNLSTVLGLRYSVLNFLDFLSGRVLPSHKQIYYKKSVTYDVQVLKNIIGLQGLAPVGPMVYAALSIC